MSFSIRLTEQEQSLAAAYAKMHGISIGEALKSALFRQIEDEYDVNLAEISLKEFEENPKTFSVQEAKKALGL